jgi:hypothetical protein
MEVMHVSSTCQTQPYWTEDKRKKQKLPSIYIYYLVCRKVLYEEIDIIGATCDRSDQYSSNLKMQQAFWCDRESCWSPMWNEIDPSLHKSYISGVFSELEILDSLHLLLMPISITMENKWRDIILWFIFYFISSNSVQVMLWTIFFILLKLMWLLKSLLNIYNVTLLI